MYDVGCSVVLSAGLVLAVCLSSLDTDFECCILLTCSGHHSLCVCTSPCSRAAPGLGVLAHLLHTTDSYKSKCNVWHNNAAELVSCFVCAYLVSRLTLNVSLSVRSLLKASCMHKGCYLNF